MSPVSSPTASCKKGGHPRLIWTDPRVASGRRWTTTRRRLQTHSRFILQHIPKGVHNQTTGAVPMMAIPKVTKTQASMDQSVGKYDMYSSTDAMTTFHLGLTATLRRGQSTAPRDRAGSRLMVPGTLYLERKCTSKHQKTD